MNKRKINKHEWMKKQTNIGNSDGLFLFPINQQGTPISMKSTIQKPSNTFVPVCDSEARLLL